MIKVDRLSGLTVREEPDIWSYERYWVPSDRMYLVAALPQKFPKSTP